MNAGNYDRSQLCRIALSQDQQLRHGSSLDLLQYSLHFGWKTNESNARMKIWIFRLNPATSKTQATITMNVELLHTVVSKQVLIVDGHE